MQCDFTRCSISELGRVLSLRFPRASHFRLFEFLPVAVTQMLLMKGWNHLLENLLCFTRTFKRYQSCFNNVYLKKKEGKETNIANTVCVTRFVVLLLLHRTDHFSWKKLMQFHNHMFSACCVPNSALGPTDTKKTCDLFGRSYTDEILLYKKLNQVIKINLWDVWRYMCVCVCVCVLGHFSHVRLFVTIWTITRQAALSMGFSRQEYWSELPCPPPGDRPNPAIQGSNACFLCLLHWQAGSLALAPPGKPSCIMSYMVETLKVCKTENDSIMCEIT